MAPGSGPTCTYVHYVSSCRPDSFIPGPGGARRPVLTAHHRSATSYPHDRHSQAAHLGASHLGAGHSDVPRLDQARRDGHPEGGLLQAGAGQIRPRLPEDPGLLRLHHHREDQARDGGRPSASTATTIEKTIAGLPDGLAVLKLHYLRWVLFDIGKDTYFMYQGIFDTDFDKYTEDAVALFTKYGINTVFENLEGFPEDWKTNTPAFIKFVREHQRPSFLEYGEYPYVSADEIKKALKLKAAFSEMLDQMQ